MELKQAQNVQRHALSGCRSDASCCLSAGALRLDQPAIWRRYIFAHQFRKVDSLYLLRQAQLFKCPNSIPVQINLIPFQTVSR